MQNVDTPASFYHQFTILNRMVQKWFPGVEDQPSLITDCETPLTFFAPTDEAWDKSWILSNLNTDSEDLLINYFQIPEVILYHIITAGGFDPNQLTPGTDEGEFFFTLNGSPIFVGLNQTASGTLFPYVSTCSTPSRPELCTTFGTHLSTHILTCPRRITSRSL